MTLAGVIADTVLLLCAEHDVLEDGQVVGEHEVLEDHPDALRDRVGGLTEGDLRAVDHDRAVVGLLHPVQDLHQGRLAGAVLADQCVDGALPHRDVDVVVGDHAREALPDPAAAAAVEVVSGVASLTGLRPSADAEADERHEPGTNATGSPGPYVSAGVQPDTAPWEP